MLRREPRVNRAKEGQPRRGGRKPGSNSELRALLPEVAHGSAAALRLASPLRVTHGSRRGLLSAATPLLRPESTVRGGCSQPICEGRAPEPALVGRDVLTAPPTVRPPHRRAEDRCALPRRGRRSGAVFPTGEGAPALGSAGFQPAQRERKPEGMGQTEEFMFFLHQHGWHRLPAWAVRRPAGRKEGDAGWVKRVGR